MWLGRASTPSRSPVDSRRSRERHGWQRTRCSGADMTDRRGRAIALRAFRGGHRARPSQQVQRHRGGAVRLDRNMDAVLPTLPRSDRASHAPDRLVGVAALRHAVDSHDRPAWLDASGRQAPRRRTHLRRRAPGRQASLQRQRSQCLWKDVERGGCVRCGSCVL